MAAAGRRFLTVEARAVRYHKHGHPTKVLRLETVKLDSASMKPSEVLVQMLAAPITPGDAQQIAGFEGKAPSFPRAGGNEGVGVVVEAGASSKLAKGDVVVASSAGVGTWATHVVAEGGAFTKVAGAAPGSSEAFSVEAAAAAVGAPLTAKALLATVSLAAGDVVVLNNGASAVGQAVIQYAAAAGVRTVVIAPKASVADWANAVYHLQGLGATVVVDSGLAGTPAFGKLLADLPAPKLGINGSGGACFRSVAAAVAPGATVVTYAGKAVTVPLSTLVSKGVSLRGFSLARHLAGLGKAERDAAVNAAIGDVRGDKGAPVKLLLAREPLADFLPHALARAAKPASTERTVVAVMPK